MARKSYTAAFKLQAVTLLPEQHRAMAEVARRLGVSENGPREWRKAVHAQGEAAVPGHGQRSPADDERRRLRAAVRRLPAERDRLTKAAAYFASSPT